MLFINFGKGSMYPLPVEMKKTIQKPGSTERISVRAEAYVKQKIDIL